MPKRRRAPDSFDIFWGCEPPDEKEKAAIPDPVSPDAQDQDDPYGCAPARCCLYVQATGDDPQPSAYIKESALGLFNDILSRSYNEPNQTRSTVQLPDSAVWNLDSKTLSSDSQHFRNMFAQTICGASPFHVY